MAKISWKDGLELEHYCAIILREQEENGVYFDLEKALFLINDLDRLKAEQEELVRPYLKYNVIPLEQKVNGGYKHVSKIHLKNGDFSGSVLSHYPSNPFIVEGFFSRIEIEEPSISKRKIIVDQLLRLGWEPTLFTDKGFPKLTDKGEPVVTLLEVGDFGKALSMWQTFSHRQSQIRGLIDSVRIDHRIPARCNTVGTNTFRCKHSIVVNIPRVGSVYGIEMRSLFMAAPGKKLVTVDLSGIELRLLAHHLNDPEYVDVILNGDIHTYNQNKAGLQTRNQAKSMIYCWLYGGGNSKLGQVVGGTAKDGARIKETFLREIPSLSKLLNKVRAFIDKYEYLPSIDNRKIFIRKFEGRLLTHTGINCLLQANASIIAKRFMVIMYDLLVGRGIDFKQVLFMHDEISVECSPEDAEEVGSIMLDSVRKAGEYYSLRIRLDGECKIGNNWSETH